MEKQLFDLLQSLANEQEIEININSIEINVKIHAYGGGVTVKVSEFGVHNKIKFLAEAHKGTFKEASKETFNSFLGEHKSKESGISFG